MSGTDVPGEAHDEMGHYEIRIRGHLDSRWADWFEGLTMTRDVNGETLLTGSVVDQAALHGLLKKVRDLGLPLLSVIQIEPTGTRGTNVDVDSGHIHSDKKQNP